MSIIRNKTWVSVQRFLAVVVVFFVLVAAANTVRVVKDAQGREGPGSYYKLVKLIPAGTTLEILETKRSWHKVKYEKVEVWISANSLAQDKKTGSRDIFESMPFQDVSAEASPAILTAAIKGFWTRFSKTAGETYELPVEGYDIPAAVFETFSQDRAGAVGRENLIKKYKLKMADKKHSIPYKQEHSVGYTCASSAADAPLVTDMDLLRYIHSVGWYIAGGTERYDIRFNYYILDTDRVNAIACPGGYIVLTRGLLNLLNDESELAALLAHEMAHVIAGHGMLEVFEEETSIRAGSAFDALNREVGGASELEQELVAVSQRAVSIAKSPKLDKYEFEADELALCYMARSGYDLNGHVRLLATLKAQHDRNVDIFDLNYRNHPDFGERTRRSEDTLKDYRGYTGKTFPESFREHMVF